MPPELGSALVHYRAVLGLEALAFEERAVVVACKEARFLALAAPCRGQAGTLRFGPRLGLGLLTERKRDAVQACRIDSSEHVGLILLRVRRAGEEPPPLVVDDSSVMTGAQRFRAGSPRECEQSREAKAAVAVNTGVRGLSALVPSNERIDHGPAKRFAQVEGDMRHSEAVTRRAGGQH